MEMIFGNTVVARERKSSCGTNILADERLLKEGTIEAVQTILHQVFQIAVDDEWIDKNPSDHAVKELKRSHQMDTKKRQALSRAEQELLLSFLSENTPNARWYPITAVLLGAGMRVGEATGLRWCDIDCEEGMINVNHTLVYYAEATERKKQQTFENLSKLDIF